MARFDRCVICDYTEQDGAPHLGVNPGRNGRVRLNSGEMRCQVCAESVADVLAEFEEENEQLDQD